MCRSIPRLVVANTLSQTQTPSHVPRLRPNTCYAIFPFVAPKFATFFTWRMMPGRLMVVQASVRGHDCPALYNVSTLVDCAKKSAQIMLEFKSMPINTISPLASLSLVASLCKLLWLLVHAEGLATGQTRHQLQAEQPYTERGGKTKRQDRVSFVILVVSTLLGVVAASNCLCDATWPATRETESISISSLT